jgi:prevent-host-death family protein
MPISDAREHLADVVNRAAYGGEPTYLTRRGRRLAVVVSPAELAAGQARAAYAGVVQACRQMWAESADKDEMTRQVLRGVIDRVMELAEDTADVAEVIAVTEDRASGAEPESWEQVKSELGL